MSSKWPRLIWPTRYYVVSVNLGTEITVHNTGWAKLNGATLHFSL